MQPEFVEDAEPSVNGAAEPALPEPAPNEPFWTYLDVGMFLLLAFGFLALLATPIVMVFKPQAGQKSFVVIALIVQLALYLSIYAALFVVFRLRYHRPVFRSLGWHRVNFNLGWSVLWGVSLTALVAGVITVLRAPQVPSPVEGLITSRGTLIAVALLAAGVAPIFEEALFRGFLQPLL